MSETNGNSVQPPYSDTGVGRTSESGLRALVDWVSITFKKITTLQEICGIITIPESNFTINDNGFNGYTNSAHFGSIIVCWGTPETQLYEMGCSIIMSGEGCREYEQYFDKELDWSSFFALCLNFDVNFTRLDLAIDDFKGYFTIVKAYNKAYKGHIKTPFKIGERRHQFRLDGSGDLSNTLYLGSTDKKFRFYDKFRERINKGFDIPPEIKVWNRYEIQLRHESASSAAFLIAHNERELGMLIKGLFKKYTDFKVPNKTDSNRRRWKSCKWWTDFLGECETIGLTQVAPDVSIPRKKMWIDNQVISTLSMLNYAVGDDDLFMKYLKTFGTDNLTTQQLTMADDFRNDIHAVRKMKRELNEVIMINELGNEKTFMNVNENKKRNVWLGHFDSEKVKFDEIDNYVKK